MSDTNGWGHSPEVVTEEFIAGSQQRVSTVAEQAVLCEAAKMRVTFRFNPMTLGHRIEANPGTYPTGCTPILWPWSKAYLNEDGTAMCAHCYELAQAAAEDLARAAS